MRPVLHDATVQRTAGVPGGISLRHVAQTRDAIGLSQLPDRGLDIHLLAGGAREQRNQAVEIALTARNRPDDPIDVDHHGVKPAGLTIRVNFDEQCLPEACWWYAEQLEVE